MIQASSLVNVAINYSNGMCNMRKDFQYNPNIYYACRIINYVRALYYLQRSYPSEYKRYSPNAFIIISIEDSSSMPDPAPQPQQQPPQVQRPPQDAVVQNIVASATPAGDTPTTPDQLEVHVVLAFPLSFYTFLFCTSSDRFVAPVTLVVFYPLRFSLY